MTTVEEPAAPAFDPDALREKYRAERDKRLRPDGNDQYVEITGRFAHYLDDPYVEPIERDPLFDEVDVVVIGGGFGGLLAGARLKEAGITDVRIIEKGGDFGGTWYWNRYPGAQCDIESYIYLPLLEEIGYIPKEKYTRAPEILEHSRNIGDHFGLYDGALFQTEVTSLTWDDDASRWLVATNRGDELRARFVVHGERSAAPPEAARHPGRRGLPGPLVPHEPVGLRLHRRRLRGEPRRSSPASASASSAPAPPRCRSCRTSAPPPSSCTCSSGRRRRSTCATTARRIPSGRRRSSRAGSSAGWRTSTTSSPASSSPRTSSTTAGPTSSASCSCGCARRDGTDMSPDGVAAAVELADFDKMESIRARVDTIVNDPNTAEALKPYYRQFCKRPCFHDEYLDTYNRPNVTLVAHRRPGRRPDHRARRRRRRDRVRDRLPHLRHRLRGRHRLHPPRRLRDHRS